jgi:hypothetical protein
MAALRIDESVPTFTVAVKNMVEWITFGCTC